jgi:hypothetical protein
VSILCCEYSELRSALIPTTSAWPINSSFATLLRAIVHGMVRSIGAELSKTSPELDTGRYVREGCTNVSGMSAKHSDLSWEFWEGKLISETDAGNKICHG